jgi:ferredoxin
VTEGRPAFIATAAAELARHGLILRGGFNFDLGDPPPIGPADQPAISVLLVGQAGAKPWPHFLAWLREQRADLENPLDTWSRQVIEAVAEKIGARAVSPNDRPYLPFQQWAMRAEGLRPSPLGILMHPEFGLWHAYRGALLFDVEIPMTPLREAIHLCDLCDGKPCLKACPVSAHSAAGFDHAECLAHVRAGGGGACMSGGCLDRNACPYGAAYRYAPDQQTFHMEAFAR